METRLSSIYESFPAPIRAAFDAIGDYDALQAILIIFFALFVAKLADWILTRWVSRLAARTGTDIDDALIRHLHRPVFVTVFLWGLMMATVVLGLPEKFELTTVRILKTVMVWVWLSFLIRACSLFLNALSQRRDKMQIIEARTVPLFDNLAKIVIAGGGIYAMLQVWDIDAGAWLASAGIAGLAIGFAAKDSLANLFSGIFILTDRPYKIGDFIVLDSGERGRVTGIGLRSSRLLTRDDIEVIIPNAVIANAKIINETGGPHEKERVRVGIGVAYGSDVDQVCEVLERIGREADHVCDHPEPRVRFRRFGDSSLDFELLCWIDEPVLRGATVHKLNMDVYKALQRERIEIPFPQRDIHIKQMPDARKGEGS